MLDAARLLALRYILKAAGKDTILVIPACCNSVIQGVYPYMLHTVPVYNIAFAAAAACASGMSEALRAKGEKKPTSSSTQATEGPPTSVSRHCPEPWNAAKTSYISVTTTKHTETPACRDPARPRLEQ